MNNERPNRNLIQDNLEVNIDDIIENSDDSPNSSIVDISDQSSVYEHESLNNESDNDHMSLGTSGSSEIIQYLSNSEDDNSTDEEILNDDFVREQVHIGELQNEDIHMNADVNFEELRYDRNYIHDNEASIDDNEGSDEEYDLMSDEEEIDYANVGTPLLKLLQKDDANETLTANLVVNQIEMLMGIMKIADVYSLPNSFIADICGLFNSFFETSILPDSRYKLDRLFYNRENINYHAVCPECKSYIKEFQSSDRQVICEVCEAVIDLKDPCYNEFFVIFNVKDEIKHLIEENREFYEGVISNQQPFGNVWNDFHNGKEYEKFLAKLPETEKNCYATLSFNSDGSPIWKSSKFSIWPAQVQINELPPIIKCKNTITIGLWFGHDKPNMNIFLSPLAKSLNNLSETGIQCNFGEEVRNIKVYTLCCCVDNVARAPMQGIIQFNGYYGCSWCLHPGESVRHNTGRAMKYTLQNEVVEKRTEEETLQHIQQALDTGVPVYGIKNATPLLLLRSFNIISGFVPDSMHCVALGVSKQFFEYWFSSTQEVFSISKANMNKADTFVKKLKVPTQLARLSRSIKDRKFWKSKEWENWLLYYSLPILHEIPRFSRYAKHWSLLVESVHLLMNSCITRHQLLTANDLLKRFVAETEVLYSKDAMTYNVHQLIHLAQSVADWGPLWAHIGYPFENGNGEIIKKVHSAKGVISQVCRSICRKSSLRIVEKHLDGKNSPVVEFTKNLRKTYTKKCVETGNNKYFGKPKPVPYLFPDHPNIGPDTCKAYDRFMKNSCIFKTCERNLQRSDNSYAQTDDGEYIQCVKFIVVDGSYDEYTVYKKVQVGNFSSTCKSIKKNVYIDEDLHVIETRKIEKLCVFMAIDGKQYISAIPNMYWYS